MSGSENGNGRLQDGKRCLEAALQYLSMGWSVLALCPGDHVGVGREHGRSCKSPGKRPLGSWKEYQERLPTEDEARRKWEHTPNCNVGIALGPVSGLVRIDVEGDSGEAVLNRISAGNLPPTLEFSSGREGGGRGLLYRIPKGFQTRTTYEKPGEKQEIRFQAKGAQTVLPPSRHASGRLYEWKPGHGPNEIKPALAPDWLLEELRPRGGAAGGLSGNTVPEHDSINEGSRDDFLISVGGLLRRWGLSERGILNGLLAVNQTVLNPPMELSTVEEKARSAGSYPSGEIQEEAEVRPPECKLPPFPVDIFPPSIQRFVRELSAAVSCPDDFPGIFVLAMASSAIGTSRSIVVSRTWQECPRLYIALVADPGEAKSPAMDLVCAPIYRRQTVLAKQWEAANQAYEDDLADFEYRRQRAGRVGAGNILVGERPAKPTFPHLFTGDATTEALAAMLKDSPRGFAMIRDEITSWISGMNQYKGGRGSDRQFWLSVWSGSKAKVDRKSQLDSGSLIIDHPFVNVCGNIQPDMLGQLCDEHARQDGFIHRILFSFPGANKWPEHIGLPISEESEAAWAAAIDRLYEMEMTRNSYGMLVPEKVRMSNDAKSVADLWFREHAVERNSPGFPAALVGPWAKMKSYFFRLALTIHLLHWVCSEDPPQEIGAAGIAGAWLAIDYFKSHCRKVYDQLRVSSEDKRSHEVVEWIKSNGGHCTARELQRAKIVKKASAAKSLMLDLEDRNYGRVRNISGKSGPSVATFVLFS